MRLAQKLVMVFSIGLGVFSSERALAMCYEPSFYGSVPSSYLRRPSVPFCLSSYSYTREHDCDQWEIDSYLSDVDDYIDDLNQLIRDANQFAIDAQQFASEMYEFASCEAKEVQTQHE